MIYPIVREIIHGDKISIQILSRELAEITTHDQNYCVISIYDPQVYPCNVAQSDYCKDILRLAFTDVEEERNNRNVITEDHAKQVVDFVNKNNTIRLWIVHCEMGMSRSAGVGAAIAKAINGDDTAFFKFYTPNMTCYRKVLNAFVDAVGS